MKQAKKKWLIFTPGSLQYCSQNDCISFCRNHCIFVSCLHPGSPWTIVEGRQVALGIGQALLISGDFEVIDGF